MANLAGPFADNGEISQQAWFDTCAATDGWFDPDIIQEEAAVTPPAPRTTRNTRSYPLGVQAGTGFRMHR